MPRQKPSDLCGAVEVVHPASEDYWVEIPMWAWDGVAEAVVRDLHKRAVGSGRKARWVQRWRQDMIDFARWEAVNRLHREGVKFTDGDSHDELWIQAARAVKGTTARGGVDAIRKSYGRVKKRLKDEPFRYKIFSHIGIPGLGAPSPPRE